MHLPLMRTVLPGPMVQRWAAVPSQLHITISVSFVAESWLSSRHLAGWSPETIGPAASGVTTAGELVPESPTVVRATTATLYLVPLVSPVILQVTAVVMQLAPLGEAVAV